MANRETKAQRRGDVLVANHGSVVMVQPVTRRAQAWVEEHVALESWQWMGGAFAVEPRYLDNLVEGMAGDGLVVQ